MGMVSVMISDIHRNGTATAKRQGNTQAVYVLSLFKPYKTNLAFV